MNENAVIGILLVLVAGVLAYVLAASEGGLVESLVGKAVWYLPYAALVGGLRKLSRVRR